MRFLIKVLLLSSISVGVPSRGQSDNCEYSGCDDGWLPNGSDCYFFNHDAGGKATWVDADSVCHFLGGHLVDIRNEDEWGFVKGKLKTPGQYMIGITDKSSEGNWIYSEGGGGAYVKWISGQPSSGTKENCGSLIPSNGGLYNDIPCTGNSFGKFVCKKAAQ